MTKLLEVQKFNMQWIDDNCTVMILGKRNTGKSFLLKDLLFYHQDIPTCVVVCPTESSNKFYSKFIPSLFIFEEYNEEIINYFKIRQTAVKQLFWEEKEKNGTSTIDGRSILILDDCLYDDKWTRSVNIRWMFMNGRHSDGMFIMTSQSPLGITPALRNNLDYIFILRNNIDNERRKIYMNYASIIPSYDIFCEILSSCTEDYKCLVIHISSTSNNLLDCVFWYKAENHDDFTLGSQEYWNYHQEHFNENYNESIISDLTSINNQPNLFVRNKNSNSSNLKVQCIDINN